MAFACTMEPPPTKASPWSGLQVLKGAPSSPAGWSSTFRRNVLDAIDLFKHRRVQENITDTAVNPVHLAGRLWRFGRILLRVFFSMWGRFRLLCVDRLFLFQPGTNVTQVSSKYGGGLPCVRAQQQEDRTSPHYSGRFTSAANKRSCGSMRHRRKHSKFEEPFVTVVEDGQGGQPGVMHRVFAVSSDSACVRGNLFHPSVGESLHAPWIAEHAPTVARKLDRAIFHLDFRLGCPRRATCTSLLSVPSSFERGSAETGVEERASRRARSASMPRFVLRGRRAPIEPEAIPFRPETRPDRPRGTDRPEETPNAPLRIELARMLRGAIRAEGGH
eukprot:scaffold1386_cov342-Pavlova_lutheri.AAC.26